MPRFVILRHEIPPGYDRGTHFDLMLEMGGVLRTWSLHELPVIGKVIEAEALPDHRLAYLEYEGPVSGNRGTVSRVEEGEYDMLDETEIRLRYRLVGKLLGGMLTLQRDEKNPSCWTAYISAG
ncbi:MAG: DNA polymerase ligase N-terminal domain-containing protein [Pirellulaceae bacterium]